MGPGRRVVEVGEDIGRVSACKEQDDPSSRVTGPEIRYVVDLQHDTEHILGSVLDMRDHGSAFPPPPHGLSTSSRALPSAL